MLYITKTANTIFIVTWRLNRASGNSRSHGRNKVKNFWNYWSWILMNRDFDNAFSSGRQFFWNCCLFLAQGYSNCNYRDVCARINLPTLFDRREELCRSFFKDMLKSDNCLNYLLPSPSPRHNETVTKLTHYYKF